MSFKKNIANRIKYYQRIFSAYLGGRNSHLTFWHEIPELNQNAFVEGLGEYYMTFAAKADYPGPYDPEGIPLLDYHGHVGLQYNPIAIAQYGLGHYNLFHRTGSSDHHDKFMKVADWLIVNLEKNPAGLWVWNHHFDWEYRTPLKNPWYSALSQGQGLSLLARAYQETKNPTYLDAAERAFEAFVKKIHEGGVTYVDKKGHAWFEEAIVDPPTHILNGFIWATWGIYDYYLLTQRPEARSLFLEATQTFKDNLYLFDIGFWSLYEQSGTHMKMLASPFYHSLHVVQLQVMYRLTGETTFNTYAHRWDKYRHSLIRKTWARTYKSFFKLLYY